jgi:hypothetical protein
LTGKAGAAALATLLFIAGATHISRQRAKNPARDRNVYDFFFLPQPRARELFPNFVDMNR